MKKFIQTCALFFLAFCATQLVWNMLFLKNIGIPYAHNIRFSTKYVHYLKKEKEYNTLFLGSSRTYRQINPAIIDVDLQDVNIKSYNLGAPGTFNPEAFYLLNLILENKPDDSPLRYIFLELTELSPTKFENWFAPQSYYYLNASYLELVLKTHFTNKEMSWITKMERTYPFLQGFVLNAIFLIHPLQIRAESENYLGEKRDGFYPLDVDLKQNGTKKIALRNTAFLKDTSVLAERARVQHTTKKPEVSQAYISFLNGLIQKAERHHVKLFFIIPPKLKNYTALTAISERVDDHRVIDLGSAEEFPEFYLARYCYDKGHFNSLGAEMYSRILAGEIRKKLGRSLSPN